MVRASLLLLAPFAASDELPTTLSYRPASAATDEWSPAPFMRHGAPARLVSRRGGFDAPAPADASYDWLRPGAWDGYVAALYGGTAKGAPTIGDVDLVYDVDGLLDGVTVDFACPARDDRPFKRFNWHAPYNEVHYFRRRTAVDRPPAAHGNGTWVEVSHCGGSRFEKVGAFFYVFRGSGLYVNVGRTVAFETHQDAALYFLGRPCDGNRTKPTDARLGIFQCDGELPAVVSAARRRGWDSLQFTHHCDAFCEGGSMKAALSGADPRSQLCGFELVLTNTTGAGPCPPGVQFRRGLGGAEPCACDADAPLRSQRGACAACAAA